MAGFNEYVSDRFLAVWPQFESTLKRTKSRASYMYYVNGICNFCRCDFLDIDNGNAQKYFFYLSHSEKRYSPKYLHSILSGCRSISEYISTHQELYGLDSYENPFSVIYLDSYSDQLNLTDVPTPRQIEKILSVSKKKDLQLYLVFSFAFYCGLTISEILSLHKGSIFIDERAHAGVYLPSRSVDSRYVKIPDHLISYIEEFCSSIGERSFLFANAHGRPLQKRTLQSYVSSFMENLDVPLSYTLQQLRNASTVFMRVGGATSSEVAIYTGVSERWMYRYDGVVDSLESAPCDRIAFSI